MNTLRAMKKIYILNKKLRKLCFCQRLYPNQIQINEQTTAWVDRFQQNIQSFTVLNHFLRPLSFGFIYMLVNVWWFIISHLLIFVISCFLLLLRLWFDLEMQYSFRKWVIAPPPPLHHITVKTQKLNILSWRWKSSNNDRFSNTAPCEQTGSPALKQTEQYFIFNVESTTESPQKIRLLVAYV